MNFKMYKKIKENKKGSMFLFVMIFGFIAFTTITMGMVSYSIFESKAAKQTYRHDLALHVAEAGIDYYRWHLIGFADDYYDGQGEGSFCPYVHDYYDKDGNVVGTFSLEISVPPEGTHVVEVRSTGWSIDSPTSKRTVQAYFGYESFSDSAFVVNANMNFSPTSIVHGKVFSNGCINFDGTSDSWVESAKQSPYCGYTGFPPVYNDGVYGSGGPTYFWKDGQPTRSFAGVSADFTALKNMADAPDGLNLGHSYNGWHIVFQSSGTFKLYRINSINSSKLDITSETYQYEVEIPENGVIYSNSDLWVEGVVNGRVTVVADIYSYTPSDIIIPGNLVYNEKYSDDVLGLLSYRYIFLPYTVPNNMEIDGALLARSGSIYRPYFSYSIKNSLSMFGSQIEYLTGGFKYGNPVNSGFINTIYTYDGNLLYQPPIGIPVIPQYKLISWQEVPTGNGPKICQTSACNDETTISYAGQTYDIVEIGDQCWFADNLNVGTMLASGATLPSNNSAIEKWCYNNFSSNCDTYGGMYTWAEALQLSFTCITSICSPVDPVQGICPTGWHIPSDAEYKTLEMYLGMTQVDADATSWRGTDQGTKLKVGGSSSFDATYAGNRDPGGAFYSQGFYSNIWVSSENDAYKAAWWRILYSGYTTIARGSHVNKEKGFSVRCVKN